MNATLILDGASGASPNPCGCTPPDPTLGVGPNHVFEMVNLAGIIYAKNGTIVKNTFSLLDFFKLPTSSLSDPQVFYDIASGRWFASILDISGRGVQFAVSTTDDPTGTFTLFFVSASPDIPDQPFIGVNDDKFVITVNDFNSRGTLFLGSQYWIINKSELLSRATTIHYNTISPDSTTQSLRAARHLTPSTIFYMVTNCVGSCVTDAQSTTSTVRLLSVNGTPPGPVSINTRTITVNTSTQPPNAQQAGTTTLLTTNDNRILSAVWELNTLWLSWSDSCTPSGDTTTRSCLHLVQLTTSGSGPPTKSQDFEYSSNGEYLYYPALTLSHGQVSVVYGRSSSTTNPSLLATGRNPSDPPGTMKAPVVLKTGTAPDLSTRYGDYFGAAADPNPSPTSTFWLAGEYRSSTQSSLWSTAVARIASFTVTFNVSISNPKLSFSGVDVATTGSLIANTSNSTFSGSITIVAENATNGNVLFQKTYSIHNSSLQAESNSEIAFFLLDIPVAPFPVSANFQLTIKNGTPAVSEALTRQVDLMLRGEIDIVDAAALANAFDSTPGSPKWNPFADFYAEGKVDIRDAALLAFLFGAPSFS